MEKKISKGVAFRTLVNCFHPEGEGVLAPYLSEELREEFLSSETSFAKPEEFAQVGSEILARMHYSWLIPAIEKLEGPLQAHFIALLPENRQKKILAHFQIASLPKKLHPFLSAYLKESILKELGFQGTLPISFTVKSDHGDLESLSKDEILDVADALGLYDITKELRHIVDKSKLALIVESLSPFQQTFLKKALHERYQWGGPEVGIEHWAGDKKNLRRTLHKRGMARLGVALKSFSPEYVALFLLKLDTGRAERIEQMFAAECPEEEIYACEKQLTRALQHVKERASHE